MKSLRGALVLPLFALFACKPSTSVSGSIQLESGPFTPTKCEVVLGLPGVELSNAQGDVVSLSFAKQSLANDEQLTVVPAVTARASGMIPKSIGECGSLNVTGQAYHANGKRALTGSVTLDCPGARGDVTFDGCF